MNEVQAIRERTVRTITLIVDNDRPLSNRLQAMAEMAIIDQMGTGTGRDTYEQMLRGGGAFGYDRSGYAQVVGNAVRDELIEMLDEEATLIVNSWVWLLLIDLLDLHDSAQTQMLGDHYLPESADDIDWPDDATAE